MDGGSMCLLLMDEHGDTGLKLGQGSSATFTVCMVLFKEQEQAAACKARFQPLRQALGMKLSGRDSEFHFTALSPARRKAFLEMIAEFPFRYYACTLKKEKLSGRAWQKKDYVYQRAGVMALDQVLNDLLEAKLLFDATSGEKFDKDFLRFLKKHAGYHEKLRRIKDAQRVKSHAEELIQIVDMVCGALASDDPDYLDLIRHREGGVRVYPP
jgi:hypothetical protein